jgi:Zn-dependent protease/CBS domain-containing protein
MRWSIKIADIGGTAVRIHVTFLLLLAWIWIANYQAGGAAAAWQATLFILLIFLCVLLHEFGHVFAARRFGINTPDVTLLPIGGLARLERMPERPREELIVAIAGPLVNVVIAAVLLIFLGGTIEPDMLDHLNSVEGHLVAQLAAVNIFIVLFNLIPAFPMDGGRVLRALLAMRLGYSRATQIAASLGQVIAFVFGFIGLLYNPLLIFIAIFVYLAATAEAQTTQIREVSSGVLIRDAMITQFARLAADATVNDAVEALLRTTQHEFPVVGADGRLLGILTRDDMIRALKDTGLDTPVRNVMRTEIPLINERKSLDEAFRYMQGQTIPAVGVVDRSGRLVGLVTSENIGEMMMVRAIVPEKFGRGEVIVPG